MKRISSLVLDDGSSGAAGVRRPGRLSRPGLLVAITALALGPASGQVKAQRNVLQALDFNGDGLTDLRVVYEKQVFDHSVYWLFTYLEAQGANRLLASRVRLSTNDLVTLDPGPGSAWQPRLDLWCTAEYVPVFTNLPYVGVRFEAADGNHLGWLHVKGDREVSDYGWQPQPGQPIRVGDKPVAAPGSDEWVQTTAVDLDGGGIDFVLRVRRWTNLVAGVVGTAALLTNRAGFEVLAVPGVVEGKAVWHPWPAPEGYLISPTPPSGVTWAWPTAGAVLLEERRSLEGALLERAGPLAGGQATTVVVRSGTGGGGWLEFGGDATLRAQYFEALPRAVGEPPPQPGEFERLRWDLNQDGRVEFVHVRRAEEGYAPGPGGGGWSSRQEELHPIGLARTLGRPGLTANDTLTASAPTGRVWQSTNLLLSSDVTYPGGGGGSYRFAGLLGLRFESAAGVHLAWASRDGVCAFEPRPGVPVRVGVIPKSLGAVVSGNQLELFWNRSLTNHQLVSAASLDAPVWQPVPLESPGRAEQALAVVGESSASRFFRLVLPGLAPGLLQVFQELPGAVHAAAFRGDANHVVVVDDAGLRFWRADGLVEFEIPLGVASFSMTVSMTGAVVSAKGTHVICAGGTLYEGDPANPLPFPYLGLGQAVWVDLDHPDGPPKWFCPFGHCFEGPAVWNVHAISADGQQALLAADGDLSLARQEQLHELPRLLPGARPPCAFSPDGLQLICCTTSANAAELRVLADWRRVRSFPDDSALAALAWSPDGQHLATCGSDAAVRLWQVNDGNVLRTFDGQAPGILTVVFSPDGRYLIAGGTDRAARLWRVDSGALVRAFEGHSSQVTAVAISPDNQRVATGTADGMLLLWDVAEVVKP